MKVLNRFAAAALMLAIAGPLYAADPVPAPQSPSTPTVASTQDPTDEISALRARLDKLEAQQREAAQKAEINKTAQQVSEDATHRSQMMDVGSFTAGYKDGRFYVGSEDGNFMWRPWFHMQFRDVTNDRQNFKDGGKDDQIDNGFELRRMRFGFDGNLFTKDFTYFFNWATVRASSSSTVTDSAGDTSSISNNLGGTPLLEEAWVKYHLPGTDFSIKGGQIKDPFMHDQIVSSRYQQSAERSLTADIFANGDAFVEGVTVIYDPNSWVRTEGGLTHGIRSANTNFQTPQDSTNAYNYGAAGRVEFKAMGNWADYAQVGAVDTKNPLLVVGLGTDYAERGGKAGQTMGVADVMYADPNGLNLYGAFVDRYTDHNFGIYTQSATGASIGTPDPAVAGRHTNEYAAVAQVGYLVNGRWEPFGRYEYMHLQGTAAGSKNYVQALTGGVNYYFYGHRAKITCQLDYLPNGIPIADTPNDVLASPGGHGEFSGIVQFQLLL